jgi:hypothetical protein
MVCDLRSRAAADNTRSRVASLAAAELARAAHRDALRLLILPSKTRPPSHITFDKLCKRSVGYLIVLR